MYLTYIFIYSLLCFYTAKIQKIIELCKFLADLFGDIAFFYYLCTIFNTICAYKHKYIYIKT